MKKLLICIIGTFYCLCINAELTLTKSVPEQNAVNISTDSRIILIFNEDVKRGAGECAINGTSIEPAITGKYVIFTPEAMDNFTKYTLTMPAGAITNLAREPSSSLTLSFTTKPRPMPSGCDISVAKDGSGTYSTIQEAINAAPSDSPGRYVIYIYKGDYNENITIPAEKKNITLWGEHMNHVIINQDNATAPTITINGPGCYIYNMTIRNEAGEENSSTIKIDGDKSIIRYCSIYGKGNAITTGYGKSYFYQCDIEGSSKILNAEGSTSLFDHCAVKASAAGTIACVSTPDTSSFGITFFKSRIVSSSSNIILGEALNQTAKISFNECELPSALAGNYWNKGNFPDAELSEYMNFGPGKKIQDGIFYLPTEMAEEYTIQNIFKGWNPLNVLANTGKDAATWIEGDGLGANKGGNGGTEVTVSSASELAKYIASEDRYIIKIKGTIKIDALSVGSNTTITGIDESSTIIGNLRINNNTHDVIIKHLNITNPGELKVNDGISMEGCHRVLVEHISFYDCSDGVCDMRNGTDSVTLRWNKIYYVNQLEGHRFTMIADGALTRDDNSNVIEYGTPLHITFHHNWWSTLCHERMPSSTNTIAHLYNCYWNCNGNYYCSLARAHSRFYSENNYYANVKNPIYKVSTGSGIYTSGNIYNRCTGTIAPGSDNVTAPDYKYIKAAAKDIPEIVSARAGNYWIDPEYIPTENECIPVKKQDKPLISSFGESFTINLTDEAKTVQINIFNLKGICVLKGTYKNKKTIKTDIRLPNGVYIIKIGINNKKEIIKAMIK